MGITASGSDPLASSNGTPVRGGQLGPRSAEEQGLASTGFRPAPWMALGAALLLLGAYVVGASRLELRARNTLTASWRRRSATR